MYGESPGNGKCNVGKLWGHCEWARIGRRILDTLYELQIAYLVVHSVVEIRGKKFHRGLLFLFHKNVGLNVGYVSVCSDGTSLPVPDRLINFENENENYGNKLKKSSSFIGCGIFMVTMLSLIAYKHVKRTEYI